MSEQVLLRILDFALKFGIDAAIALAKSIKPGATIDDAIAALEMAKTKTAQDYLDEAKANTVSVPVPDPVPVPVPNITTA